MVLGIVPGCEHAVRVASRHQHQRAVDRHHLVEEDGDVHRARLRHAVVARPGAVVLVPLPDIAGERGFGVDLVLVHVDLLAEQLFDRADHAGMAGEQAVRLVVQMGGEGGARRAGFLAPDFRALLAVDGFGLGFEDGDFGGGEGFRQEQVAFLMELADLAFGQHRVAPPVFFDGSGPLLIRRGTEERGLPRSSRVGQGGFSAVSERFKRMQARACVARRPGCRHVCLDIAGSPSAMLHTLKRGASFVPLPAPARCFRRNV